MPVTSIGWVHFVIAIAAIGAGAMVAFTPKATRRHRNLGRVYGWLMIFLNATAFLMYELFGRFGPFHFAALLSLITVVFGWLPVRRRATERWMRQHAFWMSGSYVGLLAAAAAETLGRIPETPFWGMVVGASVAVALIGGLVIGRTVPGILARFGEGSRAT